MNFKDENLDPHRNPFGRNSSEQVLSTLAVSAGLRAAASEVYSLKQRRGLLRIAEAMEANNSVEESLTTMHGLPEDLKTILATGSKIGRLPFLLFEYLASTRQIRALWKNFFSQLLYPLVIVSVTFALVIGFVQLAVPQFKELFNDFGVELPYFTIALIEISDLLNVVWFPALLIFLGLVVIILFKKFLPFAPFRSKLFHSLPWIGTAQEMTAAAEFCSRLAILVECRLPLDESLLIVSRSVQDPHFGHLASRVAQRVQAGETNEEIASYASGLPQALANAFRWANDPDAFAQSLRSLAIVFGSQARLTTGQIIIVTGPLAFVSVGVIAGSVVLATFLPLIKLVNELS